MTPRRLALALLAALASASRKGGGLRKKHAAAANATVARPAALVVAKHPNSGSTWLADVLLALPDTTFVHQALIGREFKGNVRRRTLELYIQLMVAVRLKTMGDGCLRGLSAPGRDPDTDAAALAGAEQDVLQACGWGAWRQSSALLGFSFCPYGHYETVERPKGQTSALSLVGRALRKEKMWMVSAPGPPVAGRRLVVCLVRHNVIKAQVSRERKRVVRHRNKNCVSRGAILRAKTGPLAHCDPGPIAVAHKPLLNDAWDHRNKFATLTAVGRHVNWPAYTVTYEEMQLDVHGAMLRLLDCAGAVEVAAHLRRGWRLPRALTPVPKNESLANRLKNLSGLVGIAARAKEPLRRDCLLAMLRSERVEHFPACYADVDLPPPLRQCSHS